MSEIIKKEDGTEIEVFTAEELEAQKQEAIEAFKAENPDKSDELIALQEELKAKEEELTKAKDKDINFSNLRKQKEAAEKKISEITAEIDTKINSVKKEVMEGFLKDHYNETLKNLAGDDEDTKKKIELHYKRLADPASTKEEIANKLRDAWLLATKPEPADASNLSVFSSGAVRKPTFKSQENKLSTEERAMLGKFGISDKDIEKYGK